MRYSNRTLLVVWLFCVASLAACTLPVGAVKIVLDNATQGETASTETYADPFAYCAGVGTVDGPDARYTGPDVPEAIVEGVREAAGVAPDAPQAWLEQGVHWRCMNSQVYACFVGANMPCWTKADTEQTPTQAMLDFCAAQQNAEVIPAAVTGHETVYAWRCNGSEPEIERQVFEIDEEGYQQSFWYAITPPSGS